MDHTFTISYIMTQKSNYHFSTMFKGKDSKISNNEVDLNHIIEKIQLTFSLPLFTKQ